MPERPGCVNLTFHGIGPLPVGIDSIEAPVWVSEEIFGSVLDLVAARRDVNLSFDDGNRSDLEIALPALRDRGLSATFFIVAGRLGDPRYLSATDVRTLSAEGMEIGCHGMHHRSWRGLTTAQFEEELSDARDQIEEAAGARITAAAIPFGRYDRRVLRALREHRYEAAYTSDGGPAQPGSWLQPRTSLRATDGLTDVSRIVSGEEALLARLRRLGTTTVKRWR